MTEIEIENGIYEAIRLIAVADGHLPDVTAYLPNDEAGYIQAIQAIKDNGRKVVYVENSGSYQNRENLEENCIIIDQEEAEPSATGTMSIPQYQYNEANDNYDKVMTANGLFDLQYRVTMVCYDAEYSAIMHDIIRRALGFRTRLKSLDNSANETGEFWCWRRNYLRLDSAKFMERGILFDIPSVDLIGNTGAGVVARAQEIHIGINTDYQIGDDPETDDEVTIIVQ